MLALQNGGQPTYQHCYLHSKVVRWMDDGDVVCKRGDSCLFLGLTGVTLSFVYAVTYGTKRSLTFPY
jgi:hypothetical protein